MSCMKRYCVAGMEKCCADCMRGEMGYCEQVCEKSKDATSCVSYQADTEIQERKKKRKRKNQIQICIAILVLIAVFLLPALALWQTYQTQQEIKAIKKELPAATGQLRDPVQVQSNNHSITQKQEQRNGKYSTKHRTT